jgi:sugar phosphate isomerase/epimerase
MGLLADTFHMNIEEPSIEGSIRRAGDRIFHFHVADSNRWHPGAGHLDFASILDALYATGYTGFVCGEFLPIPDAETAARRGIAHLRGIKLGRTVRASRETPASRANSGSTPESGLA